MKPNLVLWLPWKKYSSIYWHDKQVSVTKTCDCQKNDLINSEQLVFKVSSFVACLSQCKEIALNINLVFLFLDFAYQLFSLQDLRICVFAYLRIIPRKNHKLDKVFIIKEAQLIGLCRRKQEHVPEMCNLSADILKFRLLPLIGTRTYSI